MAPLRMRWNASWSMAALPKTEGFEWRPGVAGSWVLFRTRDEIMLAHILPNMDAGQYVIMYNAGTVASQRWRELRVDSMEHAHQVVLTALVEAELQGVGRDT